MDIRQKSMQIMLKKIIDAVEVENPTHKQVLWMLHEPDSILRICIYRCI